METETPVLSCEDKNIICYCVEECLENARKNNNDIRVQILEELHSKLEKLHKIDEATGN